MYPYGPLHIAVQKQGGQLEPTYSSSVRIRDVALGTYRKRWTRVRGCERESWISVLIAGQDDNDNDDIRGSLNKFPDFFVWALLLIVHSWNSISLRCNLLRLQCNCCAVPTTYGRPHVCERVNDLRHSLFYLLNCLITIASELRE